jgi:hypothetical protein
MPHPVFSTILQEKIAFFRASFSNTAKSIYVDPDTGKLIHPGELGAYREVVAREFLSLFCGQGLSMHSGFVISPVGSTSTQCDVVIYDRASTPLIESGERQRFFPVETIAAIGEIKSDVSRDKLRMSLNKLAKIKKLRHEIRSPAIIRRKATGAFSPTAIMHDHLTSFLVCDRFDFKLDDIEMQICGLYDADIADVDRHNMLLSINDGVLIYSGPEDKHWMAPVHGAMPLKNRFLFPGDNGNAHIHLFAAYMFMLTANATILHPEMTEYMPDGSGALSRTEK